MYPTLNDKNIAKIKLNDCDIKTIMQKIICNVYSGKKNVSQALWCTLIIPAALKSETGG